MEEMTVSDAVEVLTRHGIDGRRFEALLDLQAAGFVQHVAHLPSGDEYRIAGFNNWCWNCDQTFGQADPTLKCWDCGCTWDATHAPSTCPECGKECA